MSPKQQLAIAYDLATTFTQDGIEATELAEAIIKLCKEFCEESDND